MGMEEEEGWLMEEKGRMAKDGGFPLLEMLRLWMYSIESSESQCLSPLLPTPFIGLR